MKKSRGFTIVEIAVVITIIATITTIVTVMFMQVQKQARDKRRTSDMNVLMTALEKYYDTNGEYPTDDTLAAKITAGQVGGLIAQSGSIIGSSTTHASLKAGVAPNIDNDFGDPLRSTPDTMFNSSTLSATTGANFQYLYIGGGDFNGTGTASGFSVTFNAPSPTGSFTCAYTYSTTSGGAASYIVGFFNENNNAFVLYKGRQGTAINWNTANESRCPTPQQGN